MTFADDFQTLTGHLPFRWQMRLYERHFARNDIPAALDLPTGLGKTSAMAIWLLARAAGAPLPRRLVYVVDRRAVVDQATDEAEKLRDALEGPAGHVKARLGLTRKLTISTLRGGHVDNRDWLDDPAATAIVVGTVDMIGSRLLFEGYGVSRRMRPCHAGFLGRDALIVIDEAHLVPPFERLLEAIAGNPACFGPCAAGAEAIGRPLAVLPLSATGRDYDGPVFRLAPEDLEDVPESQVVLQRLHAEKRLVLEPANGKLEAALAAAALGLAAGAPSGIRCLVYCDRRETAEKVVAALEKAAARDFAGGAEIELFTGARRNVERQKAAARLRELGFLSGGAATPARHAFLVATSAAEVGVDLDADHMVCDPVAWERMVQRLGRVNRRGTDAAGRPRQARVVVVDPAEPEKDEEKQARLQAVRLLLSRLDAGLASPAALSTLRGAVDPALIEAASTPPPLRPALNRALVDAWSMTSLPSHPGRPAVAPWLRGWEKDARPQTVLVWRRHLPVRLQDGRPAPASDRRLSRDVDDFLAAAPPHASEMLQTETHRVVDWLVARAEAVDRSGKAEPAAALKAGEARLGPDGVVALRLTRGYRCDRQYALRDIPREKQGQDRLREDLAGRTLVLDARLGGLAASGLLNETCPEPPQTADDNRDWLWEEAPADGKTGVPTVKFRVRLADALSAGEAASIDGGDWRKPFHFACEIDAEGQPTRWLTVWKWQSAATLEDERSVASRPQSLAEHHAWTARIAGELADAMGLTGDLRQVLVVAAGLHDAGKQAERWQKAFSVEPSKRPLAKAPGPLRREILDGYRHEFGSLPHLSRNGAFLALPEALQALALHLVAAHHGQARPVIETRSCDGVAQDELRTRAGSVALRFARLQKDWGPWGLAWWEAMLRAADRLASRRLEEG